MAAGRPTKLTREIHETIVHWIGSAGALPETAAEYAGISRSTFYSWLNRGRKELSGPFREFADDVRKANAHGELHLTAVVRKNANENPAAARWLLKNRYWNRRSSRRKERKPKTEDKAAAIRDALRIMGDSGPPLPTKSPAPPEGNAA